MFAVFTNDLAYVSRFVSIEISFYDRQQGHKKFIRAILTKTFVMQHFKRTAFNGLNVTEFSSEKKIRLELYLKFGNNLIKSNKTLIIL